MQSQLRNESWEREAEFVDANAELTNARTNYDRYQSLYFEGAVSKSQRDDLLELYKRSQARLSRAEARYNNTVTSLQKQIYRERSILK